MCGKVEICAFLWICFAMSDIQGSFFLSKQYGNGNYVCVTNTSYALSWVVEDIVEKFQAVSNYIPTPKKNSFNYGIKNFQQKKQYFIKEPWILKKSLQSRLNEPILDERWEDLMVIKTEERNELDYKHVLSIAETNFEIPLSIRIHYEAHIFLCDGKFPSTSNCYWLMLQAFKGKASSIRKCRKNQIPTLNNVYPDEPCNSRRVNTTHPPAYMTNRFWSHFILSKKNTLLTFSALIDQKEIVILKWEDTEDPIAVTDMIFHSKRVNGLWKVHDFEFLYTREAGTNVNLGPGIDVLDKSVCISMYISMCRSCKIRLSLTIQNIIISEQTFEPNHSGWNQIKFITNNVSVSQVWLNVSTEGTNGDSYWALDKIRLCQKEEFRSLALTEKAGCQLLSGSDVIHIDEKKITSKAENKCPENTIGNFCMPCKAHFYNCTSIIICSTDGCVCSAGYYSTQCYYKCQSGSYGHGCQQKCGKCYYNYYDNCDNVDGTCSSSECLEGYSGPKCDIPPSIFFTAPPQIRTVLYTEATASIIDFKIENNIVGSQLQRYTIQYKKADDSANDWTNTSVFEAWNRSALFQIKNLEPETQYLVRGVIVADEKWQLGEHLKYSNFTTKCIEISQEDVNITPTNTTVHVSFKQKSYNNCKKYSISLYEIQQNGNQDSNGTFHNLTPFTEYTLVFKKKERSFKKKFKTEEGEPTEVRTLTLNSLSSTSVELNWNEPEKINGQFKHYTVEYQQKNIINCKHMLLTEKNTKSTTTAFITISDLKPYSTYIFNVFAENRKFKGSPVTKLAQTHPSHEIETGEIPTLLSITPSNIGAKINFSQIDCETSRGPLELIMTTTCLSTWCSDEGSKTEKRSLDELLMLRLNRLQPFSNYSLEIKFCRNNTVCSEVKKEYFRTEPSEPLNVRDVSIYTKNLSSISVRWTPPYPPYGILEKYKIIHYKYNYQKVDNIVEIVPCKLWPELHCATLSSLEGYSSYTIQISAKNEKVDEFGKNINIKGHTDIGKSDPPYDLKILWTQQNNLQLQWKHPNISNGNIRHFDIIIKPKHTPREIYETLKVTMETYNLTYYTEINATNFSSTTTYTVSVSANNGKKGVSTSLISRSPPDIPRLSSEIQPETSNETITIPLSFKRPNGNSNGFRIFVLRSDRRSNTESYKELEDFQLNNLKVVSMCDVSYEVEKLIIVLGEGETKSSGCAKDDDLPLDPGTSYNVTIIVKNHFENEARANVFSFLINTQGDAPPAVSDSSLLGLLGLLLLIPLITVLYLKRHDLNKLKKSLFNRTNTFTEVLNNQDEEVPLSHVDRTNTHIQVAKKVPKIQPKPRITSTTKTYSKPIRITEFEAYVRESIKTGELDRQHAIFPRGQTKPWNYGVLKENKSKNRYNNLIAYDHSRVVLEEIEGHPYSDYINANYIDGYKINRAYIATQGPKLATLVDFWRMVWQENVRNIANLANIYEGGKKKVEKYWPDINETLEFGEITVQHLDHNVFSDYEHRIFTVTHKGESRKVQQFHFSSWPDHSVPLYPQSLVPFLRKILQIPLSTKCPILVHCSAGVGRTGTILLCDICLRMASREGTIDALQYLHLLRDQRPNMVDNVEQYKLAHLVILECLGGLQTAIPCNDIGVSVENILRSGALASQMRYLDDTQWQDEAMKTVGQPNTELLVVAEKNRFQAIIPEIQGRVFISHCPPDDETSSYINAVKVDGFRCPGRFIVTQQPMPNTLGDFWRLIDERTTTSYAIIVSLNNINPKDKTSCHFWPTTTHLQMHPVPHITLKHINTLPLEVYDVITVHLCTDSRPEALPVQIISMKKWAPRVTCPKTTEEFLSVWEQTNSSSRGTNPIFITCYDGVTASGLFVAMSFIIEKMKLEQECDVCQAVRTVRHNRREFVQDLEQFEFLYKTAVRYISEFESYANFN